MGSKLVLAAALIAVSMSASAARDANELYNKSCIACHSVGAAGAPKSFDEAAWAERNKKGMDVLVANVKNGLNAMPPKGMCNDCTDEEYKALIELMAKAKQ